MIFSHLTFPPTKRDKVRIHRAAVILNVRGLYAAAELAEGARLVCKHEIGMTEVPAYADGSVAVGIDQGR